jgi:hypothetical protein
MSRLAPDIPELQHVPEATRSLVYVGAYTRAIRSPLTWLTAAVVVAVGASIGLTSGRALFGGIGAVVGAAAGVLAAGWCFFTVILPWRTRRVLPSVIDQAGGPILDDVRDADQRLKRMVDAASRREGATAGQPADRRPPGGSA